ncbi:MAG: hypothetical protein PVH93_01815 [Nitrosopumilaceae archaeon]
MFFHIGGIPVKTCVGAPKDDLLEVTPIMRQVIKDGLDRAGIEIPFPQRVITQANQ